MDFFIRVFEINEFEERPLQKPLITTGIKKPLQEPLVTRGIFDKCAVFLIIIIEISIIES